MIFRYFLFAYEYNRLRSTTMSIAIYSWLGTIFFFFAGFAY